MNLKHYSLLLLVFVLASCANRGIGPQGGPRDSVPPVPVKYEPEMGALEFKGNRIEITFDEYIQLDKLTENLLMSPPQKTPPEVKARGKKLVVLLQDTLRDSTTYTIDFGDAVCDFREKVPLRNYSFYFSTGSTIDTLAYTGYVYDAMNLNPLKGIYVGIHEDKEDSAFVTKQFARVAKTDSAGYFRIGNMKEGLYRLYAVDDISHDYRLTIGESLAWADEEIAGSVERLQVTGYGLQDTVAQDTTLPDTVVQDVALPEGGTLFLFREEQQRLYLQRTLRKEQHRIQILFSSTPDSLPELRFLNDSLDLNYVTKYSEKKDTVTIWLADSISIAQDSLFIEARYRRTDSLYHLEWFTDTLRAIWRAPKLSAKAKQAQDRQNRNRRLDLKSNASAKFEMYDTLYLDCFTPLATVERDSFHLYERIDSITQAVPFKIADYDTLTMRLYILAKLEPEKKYELVVDSGALHDIYGITHVKGTYALQVKTLSDYSTLRVKLNPFVPKARIQVLNKNDQVVRELPAVPEGAYFEYLTPETYYMRLYIDENEDGKWTTGSWAEKRQPEPVYYFPEKIQTKSNWDFEEEWDYQAVEQTKAKPAELVKASSAKK